MDILIRALVFSAFGLILLTFNLWFVRLAYAVLRSPEFVIAPFAIVDDGADEQTSGNGLAQMLQARLKTLEYQLAESESVLRNVIEEPESVAIAETSQTGEIARVSVFRFRTVRMPTSLLSAPDINISVAGVQVGGIVPFLERFVAQPRQLAFSISPGADDTLVVAGDIQPLVTRGPTQIWLETQGSYAAAINDLALAILQRRLGEDPTNRVDSLTAPEFKALVQTLLEAADLNRRAMSGRTPQESDFGKLFSSVAPLVASVPEWLELTYFAAVLADRADSRAEAIALYRTVQQAEGTAKASPDLAALIQTGQIKERIESLAVLEDFVGEEFRLARPSAVVNAARQRIRDDIEFAVTHYRSRFGLKDVAGPILVLLEQYNNAFWAVDKNVYVTPMGVQHVPDVTFHEVAHPFVAKFIDPNLASVDAQVITESYCDLLSAWLKQKRLGQTSGDADWEIGTGAVALFEGGDPIQDRRALRSFKTRVGSDVRHRESWASVQVLANVPNHAFYTVAMRLGTDAAIEIWSDALKEIATQPTLANLAATTIKAAEERSGSGGAAAARDAWRVVGVR